MKTLLLGAKGMLGSDLADAFSDFDLTSWDINVLDITDKEAVIDEISLLQPELIINAAAYTDVDGAESNKEVAFSINEQGVRNVAEGAKKIGATIIHYSTDYVFSGNNKTGYVESDSSSSPVNTYGASKLAGEKALEEVAPRFYLLRTAWLYGRHGKNFVDTMLRLGKEKKEINVINDQYGSPTYTKDVARFTREIIEGYKPGIYHAVNSGSTTWYEYALKIFELAKMEVVVKPIKSEEYLVPAKRPTYSILRNTKCNKLRIWQEALDEYIREL